MAMTPKQAQREWVKLEKKNAINRKKSEENGIADSIKIKEGYDGDRTLEKVNNVITETK